MTASLFDTANNGKLLNRFVKATVVAYAKVAVSLHHAACMTLFHAADFGECSALNAFYNGLRVNDQTALRVWFGKQATYNEGDMTKPWIAFTKDKGFNVLKGKEDQRKGKYVLDELLALEPFYNKDVKAKDALTLEALIAMLGDAAKRANTKADNEGIELPEAFKHLITYVGEQTAKLTVQATGDKSNLN